MDSPAPAHDVDMDSFAEDEPRFSAPPPHIAARFCRKTSARRKSSAHSSRRSSLSSLHSHHSALSAHGGPQSNHIAQHLRRASIIESRKARLADRAAHVEQVRLRAAIAKATPRSTQRAERALAAQAAREKLLAEITARCEEEVRRAKKVAEETKEKKAAEHARLREEMAEKLAEAERRRSNYQRSSRRLRSTSLPAVDEKKTDAHAQKRLAESAAAKVIQRFWRFRRVHGAVTAFEKLGLSLTHVKEMQFEQLGQFLSEEHVLQRTTNLLKILGLLDSTNHPSGASGEHKFTLDSNSDRGTTRVFLSVYLILGHPIQALSNGGRESQERELIAKSQELLAAFNTMLARQVQRAKYRGSLSKSMLSQSDLEKEDLLFAFNNYSSAFHSWKTRDSRTLIDIMVNQFVELDLILQTVKNDRDGGVAEDYFHAIRHNQILLLARLKKFAGQDEALSRIRSAVRKARKQRATSTDSVSEHHIPRSSTLSDPSHTVGNILTESTIKGEQPGHGSRDTEAQSTTTTNATTKSSLKSVQQPHSSGLGYGTSSLISRLGHTMTVLPTNREISHEIQVNGTFEVQQQPWTESRKHFMDGLRASMTESMNQGGSEAAANWTHAMAVLIRDKLLNLITERHPLYERIDGFLDPKLIDQTCRAGMFSYNDFFETIAALIGQICSPGRDDAVKSFAEDTSSNTIDRLFALINIIDLMTLDHINFAFRAAASAVIEHGHEHERASFERDLNGNKHNLDNTRRWWTTARSKLASTAPSSTPPHGNSIYARGLVDLVLANSHLDYALVPETLRLDWLRLLELRGRAFKLVAVASTLLTTKIRLRRNREAQWTKDAERLMGLDLVECSGDEDEATQNLIARVVSIVESLHNMPEPTKEGLLNFVGRVFPTAIAAARNFAHAKSAHNHAIQNGYTFDPSLARTEAEEEPPPSPSATNGDVFSEQVATFVLKSLREHVYARLSAASTAEKVRVATSAAEVLARAGMPEPTFAAEVSALAETLERVRRVDCRAHEQWYAEIARETPL